MPKIIFLADTHLGFDFPLKPKKEKRRKGMDFFDNFDEMKSNKNLPLLPISLLDKLIPTTMNYQIAGFNGLNPNQIRNN